MEREDPNKTPAEGVGVGRDRELSQSLHGKSLALSIPIAILIKGMEVTRFDKAQSEWPGNIARDATIVSHFRGRYTESR